MAKLCLKILDKFYRSAGHSCHREPFPGHC